MSRMLSASHYMLAASVLLCAACAPAPTYTALSAPHTVVAGLAVFPIPNPPVVTGTYPETCHVVTETGKTLPDPTCTPGSVNPAVTQANIASTICVRGWTKTVRPTEADTNEVKRTAMHSYGQDWSSHSTVELDHDVPLELAGSDDVTNLWPEPSDLPGQGFRNTKDEVEWQLNQAVCSGKVPLADAQAAIASDWTTALAKLGIS